MKRIRSKEYRLYRSKNIKVLKLWKDNSIDSIVTDPPYHLQSIVKRFKETSLKDKTKTSKRSRGKSDGYARLSTGFMGQCYHQDTEILTWRGWKKVGEVQIGDRVASLNKYTRSVEYVPVKKHYSYNIDDDLIRIKHRSAEQIVTSNHKVVLSKNGGKTLIKVDASKISFNQFHLFNQGSWKGPIKKFYLEGKEYNAKQFLYFLGLFLGDGFTVNRKNSHKSNDFFGFSAKKERKIKAFRKSLINMGIKYKEYNCIDGYTNFYCYDFPLLRYLKKLGNSYKKYIPRDLFLQSEENLQFLYSGLIETDGHTTPVGQEVFYTSSKRLADDFQRLCLHTGRSCSISKKPASKREFMGKVVQVRALYVLSVLQRGKRLYVESKNIQRVPYSGMVHCVTLEKNHILYTRFNGKPVWSGNSWDGGDIAFQSKFWKECFRVLKPGGYLLAFGATRNYHRIACAIEEAGFEIRDCISWMYGSGFPKSHAIKVNGFYGWGTALKPACELVVVARKPLIGTVEKNVLEYGTGMLNIDGCRVPLREEDSKDVRSIVQNKKSSKNGWGMNQGAPRETSELCTKGRWPANFIHDGSEEVLDIFLDQAGITKSSTINKSSGSGLQGTSTFKIRPRTKEEIVSYNDSGSVARFFYCAKPSKKEKNEACKNIHPTVKPVSLMRYLVRLVTPPRGKCLDPFMGSGTTGVACMKEHFRFIGIEMNKNYFKIARKRIDKQIEKNRLDTQ
jgi:site-specific DNA-methyltransferase (adenine-specific)